MSSSTQPRHIAIVMDGNGRWASQRGLPRHAGHRAGIDAVRLCIEECARRQIEALTLFAFSSENWRRPADEVSILMELFIATLQRETQKLADRHGEQMDEERGNQDAGEGDERGEAGRERGQRLFVDGIQRGVARADSTARLA